MERTKKQGKEREQGEDQETERGTGIEGGPRNGKRNRKWEQGQEEEHENRERNRNRDQEQRTGTRDRKRNRKQEEEQKWCMINFKGKGLEPTQATPQGVLRVGHRGSLVA